MDYGLTEEKIKSDDFKKLKKPGEELLPGSFNEEAIKEVQGMMNDYGIKDSKGEKLVVDGIYGANTANAVMGYQKKKGLTVDGIVGDETWNSMYKDKKKSEAYFREARKNNGGDEIKTPITPKGPEMNPYKSKSEKEEPSFSTDYDVWKRRRAAIKDESFHDRVRRIWGNGGKIPSLDSKGVKKGYDAPQKDGEETDYGGIFAYGNPNGALTLSNDKNYVPAPLPRYNPGGIAFRDYAFSEDESEFSRSNRRTDIPESEYLPEDEIFATEEPELMLMSNSGSGKGTNSNSKAEEKEEEGISDFDIQCAAMAEHVYDHDKNSPFGSRLTDGWWMIDSYEGKEGMKIGVYIKRSEWWDNPTEYVLVFEGTDELVDWENNFEQAFGPNSVDMKDAIWYAQWFKAFAGDKKVTFVGHSKGGAEAIAAATVTDCDAVVFNPAWTNLEDYGLSAEGYTGNIKSYVVENEILHDVQVKVNDNVDVTYLPDQHKYAYWARYFPSTGIVGASVAIYGGIQNHKMKSVNKAIKKAKEKENEK